MMPLRAVLLLALAVVCAPAAAIAQTKPPATASAPTWTYGEHPQWGLSAYVIDGENAVGLRCLANPQGENVVAVTVSLGLVTSDDRLHYRFEGGSNGFGSYGVIRKAGYADAESDVCSIGFQNFRSARSFTLLSGAEKAKVLGRIPLNGSGAAIGKLMGACPKIERGLENCGL